MQNFLFYLFFVIVFLTSSCTCDKKSDPKAAQTDREKLTLPKDPFALGRHWRKIKQEEFHKFHAKAVSGFSEPGHGNQAITLIYSSKTTPKELQADAKMFARGLAANMDAKPDEIATLTRDEFLIVFGKDHTIPLAPRPALNGVAEITEDQFARLILGLDGIGQAVADRQPPQEFAAILKEQFTPLKYLHGSPPNGRITPGEIEVALHLNVERWQDCCVASDPWSDPGLTWLRKNAISVFTDIRDFRLSH